MSFQCPLCLKGVPLYRCPVCGASAHINFKTKTLTVHAQPLQLKPTDIKAGKPAMSFCVPSHFDCELAKPITEIDLKKLILVEAKK